MTYKQWFLSHGKKHRKILQKLSHLSDAEIIAYFRFDNMLKYEPDFCPLYEEKKKCHEMEDLNCYLCACPNFRFNDEGFEKTEGEILYSTCAIDSKDGGRYISDDAIHQNCSGCTVPHHESYIREVFNRDWFKIMQKVSHANQS